MTFVYDDDFDEANLINWCVAWIRYDMRNKFNLSKSKISELVIGSKRRAAACDFEFELF